LIYPIKISESKDYFTLNGEKFFYLGDTMWTAFYNLTLDEWRYYLEFRKTQNFNAVGINILQQWDGGRSDLDMYPFQLDPKGGFDFYRLDEEYFQRACEMLEMAVAAGFIPSLGVLHASYVPGTWATKNRPESVMPEDAVKPYVEYVVKMFSPYNPIFSIGGDNDFKEEITTRYYLKAFQAVKETNPEVLTTFCTNPNTILPEEFASSDYLDFYTFQAGHRIEEQHFTYTLAKDFYDRPVKKPIVSGEFNYEGHGFGFENYGRYNDFHVRRAIWQGVLAGAKAGVRYGAHGLWGWYRRGKEFANERFAGSAFPWQVALQFKGAWDASYSKWLFETFDLFDIEPVDRIVNENKQQRNEIRMSASKNGDKVVIYIPYSVDVWVDMDLSGFELTLIDLVEKRIARPAIDVKEGSTRIRMQHFNSDVLVIGRRKG